VPQNPALKHGIPHIIYNDSLKTHVVMCTDMLLYLDNQNSYLEFATLSKENSSCVGKLADEFTALSFFDYIPHVSTKML